MKYRLLSGWVLSFWLALSAMPAFAQDEPEDLAPTEGVTEDSSDEEASLFEHIQDVEAPDGSEDYDEIQQVRVLERTFLPSQDVGRVGTNDLGLMADNPMDLTPESTMRLLLSGEGASNVPRELQGQATKWMRDAVELVKKQIEESGKSLEMPFGVDCANQKAVQEYIAIFSHGTAGTMKTWLKRLGRWRHVLEKVLAEEGAPNDLIYLAMIESGYKPRVKSPASAAGMWQFMAGTAVEMGLTINEYVDERFDPIKAARAASAYMKKQYARYNSWPLAMAAYNGGPGTVNVAIDRYNTNDYFKLVEYGAMYEETRRYVPRIMAAALIGRNPAAFGLDGIQPDPPFVFDIVDVPGNTKLSILAQAAGCSVDDLKELNPELLKDVTPPGKQYSLRIPLNKHNAFVEKFDNVKKKYADASERMTLRFGETLEILGEDIDVPARVLRNLNGIKAKEQAVYGSEIIVPNGSRRGHVQPKDDELPLALISPEKFDFRDRECIYYETQKGDTIRAIASEFGVLPNQIAIWNELDVWAHLRPKMFLRIFVSKLPDGDKVRYRTGDELHVVARGSEEHQSIVEARKNANSKAAKSAAKSSGKSKSTNAKSSGSSHSSGASKSSSPSKDSSSRYVYYTVKSGDSLSKIASMYGVSVELIMKLNGIKDKGAIRKGQKLKIKNNK
ncbi:MAG: LysM peptidoglycan-binding domain-containing protein [Proteobacteria bacterium]|nr:LysM peptidoglycan-binding domain-containing protein [Pseudomonadota bacterium]